MKRFFTIYPIVFMAIWLCSTILCMAGTSFAETVIPGKSLYLNACAACHGANGRGAPQALVGFDLPLPDFSDCDFANREPDGDWVAVAHQGGVVRGFSEIMPAFGDILTVEEIESIITYIRTFCSNKHWPRGDLNFPKALFTEKAFPEDELIISFSADKNWTSLSSKVIYGQRFGAKNQFEIILPFHSMKNNDPQNLQSLSSYAVCLGDAAIGLKRLLHHNLVSGSIFSASAELIMPTGNANSIAGKESFFVEPFLTWGQSLPADFFLQSQAGAKIPFDSEKYKTDVFFRLAMGRTLEPKLWGRTFTPMMELMAARHLYSGEPVLWDMVPQMQISLNTRQHVLLNAGVKIPLNHTENRQIQFAFYLLWDWFDGGFFEGW
jgi:mono/diheme cytochrome c family protein